jgi:two-component system nitrogen regulation response regulator GlnG
MPTLLVIDDERNLLYSIKKCLESETLAVITAQTGKDGLERVRSEKPDAVVLDVRLPDMSGLDVFSRLRQIDARLPVVIVTAYSTSETAIEAMKRGAFEYLVKPVDLDRLSSIVSKAVENSRLSHVPTIYDAEEGEVDGDRIVGQSPQMQEVFKAIGRVAPQNVNVLVVGESGTGKELVARAIYQHSARSDGPFLAINCAALSETLLESELFGHEQGAFTGADRRRIGKFEQVDGGTIFLDEIGDMSAATQAKVLRLLQDGSFERVGSNETLHVDVRVIAATHRNLAEMVEAGDFRRDLFYRLQVFAIEIPPLRGRMEDVPPLVEHFRRSLNRSLGKAVSGIAPEAMHCLMAHDWPGNVRELQSAIKYAMVLAAGETIAAECLPETCRRPESRGLDGADPQGGHPSGQIKQLVRRLLAEGDTEIYRKVHLEVDKVLLRELLDYVGGNQTQASQLLGISRGTLHARINDLGLIMEKRVVP